MSFIKFSYGPSTYSVSFRRPDRRLDQTELQARQQRQRGLPADTSVTTKLKGWVKVKETPRQRELQTAARAANQRRDPVNELNATTKNSNQGSSSIHRSVSVSFNNLLGRWAYEDGIGENERVGRAATATALLNGIVEFASSADRREAIRVTIGNDIIVPNNHEISLSNLGIIIVRAPAESGSNAPAEPSVQTQSMQSPPRSDRGDTDLNEASFRPNTTFARPSSSRTKSKSFPHIRTWIAEKGITHSEKADRETLIARCLEGINSGEQFDLDVSDLRFLSSLPALTKRAKSITVTRGQFKSDIINSLERTGIPITELEPGSVPRSTFAETLPVPASQSGVGTVRTDAATAAVPSSNRNRLRAALDSWIYDDTIADTEGLLRLDAARNLMQHVADADLLREEGNTLRLRINADVDLPTNLATALERAGITIDRLSAAGSSGTAGGVQSERRPYPVEPQDKLDPTGINAGHASPKPEDNPDVHRPVLLGGPLRNYRTLLSAWFEELGVPEEEVTRRRQSKDGIKNLIKQISDETRGNLSNWNFDLRNLGNFSSLPPIPTNASIVTVRPNQFPAPYLEALRNSNVTVDVREASALTVTERNNWLAHLQGWANLGNERERKDRNTAGTRILAFLEQGNLNETLDLSQLNISDLPGNLFPVENTSRYVRSINLHNTHVPPEIFNVLQANGIAFFR